MDKPTVIIIAAGSGKRFAPLVEHKTLFPFLGAPLLQDSLDTIGRAGFTRVVIITNPQNVEKVKKLTCRGLEIDVVVQENPTGMGDAMMALSSIPDLRACLVVAAEFVVDELFTLIEGHLDDAHITIVGRRTRSYFDGGYLQFSRDRLTGIVEKPAPGKEPRDL